MKISDLQGAADGRGDQSSCKSNLSYNSFFSFVYEIKILKRKIPVYCVFLDIRLLKHWKEEKVNVPSAN